MNFIADMEQAYTQYGGIRPFGISLLVGGLDKKGPSLFMSEPSGVYFKYKAKALGMNSTEANKMLETQYKKNMAEDQTIKLATSIFKKILGKDYNPNRIEAYLVKENGVSEVPNINNNKNGNRKTTNI